MHCYSIHFCWVPLSIKSSVPTTFLPTSRTRSCTWAESNSEFSSVSGAPSKGPSDAHQAPPPHALVPASITVAIHESITIISSPNDTCYGLQRRSQDRQSLLEKLHPAASMSISLLAPPTPKTLYYWSCRSSIEDSFNRVWLNWMCSYTFLVEYSVEFRCDTFAEKSRSGPRVGDGIAWCTMLHFRQLPPIWPWFSSSSWQTCKN